MTGTIRTLTAVAALIAGVGIAAAQTNETPTPRGGAGMPMMDIEEMLDMMRERGMGPGAMMDRDGYRDRYRHRRGDGMRRGMGGRGPMIRIMFAVMDADGDGTLQLAEVQDFHARIFRAVDADDDGGVTQAEVRAFMTGGDAEE